MKVEVKVYCNRDDGNPIEMTPSEKMYANESSQSRTYTCPQCTTEVIIQLEVVRE